ncbi:hypothetical protein IEQ34_012191 [Dendrobium chrysotoxum]|uniref:Uncharacterized protein n=1 Tax=Dendrobium chrysotoxum TaxID=161865 RepID=A0AAV7GUY5_DENCH|nr:hypothetical protein IEQ34_012191 [Dendrobium chrysotoxum]
MATTDSVFILACDIQSRPSSNERSRVQDLLLRASGQRARPPPGNDDIGSVFVHACDRERSDVPLGHLLRVSLSGSRAKRSEQEPSYVRRRSSLYACVLTYVEAEPSVGRSRAGVFLRASFGRAERLNWWPCARLQGNENLEPLLSYMRPLSWISVQMSPNDLMLEDGVKDIRNKLASPSNLQQLLLLLDKAENLLSRME